MLGDLPHVVIRGHLLPFLTLQDIAKLRLASRALQQAVDAHNNLVLAFSTKTWQGNGFDHGFREGKPVGVAVRYHLQNINCRLPAILRGLALAAANGDVATCAWVKRTYGLADNQVVTDAQCALLCYRHGRLEVAQWLVTACGLRFAQIGELGLFSVCMGGHFPLLKWTQTQFELGKEHFPPKLLGQICTATEHLEVAKWLYGLSMPDPEQIDCSWHTLGKNGLRPITQWFCETFLSLINEPSAQHSRRRGAFLRGACAAGHFDLIKWLHKLQAFTNADAQQARCGALVACCGRGSLEMAQWLHDNCHLTTDDVRDGGTNGPLIWACRKGHLNVAQWLYSTYNLTPQDARVSENACLRLAARCGYLDVVQWLHATFQLTAKDARARRCEAFKQSCESGHTDVALWLWDTFHLSGLAKPQLDLYMRELQDRRANIAAN